MKFTDLQRSILNVLADGQPHLREELLKCFDDPEATPSRLKVALSRLRDKLRPHGHDIICELRSRQIHYRHVQLLAPPSE